MSTDKMHRAFHTSRVTPDTHVNRRDSVSERHAPTKWAMIIFIHPRYEATIQPAPPGNASEVDDAVHAYLVRAGFIKRDIPNVAFEDYGSLSSSLNNTRLACGGIRFTIAIIRMHSRMHHFLTISLLGHGTPDGDLCMAGNHKLRQRDIVDALLAEGFEGHVIVAANMCHADALVARGEDPWTVDLPFDWTVVSSHDAVQTTDRAAAFARAFGRAHSQLRVCGSAAASQAAMDAAWAGEAGVAPAVRRGGRVSEPKLKASSSTGADAASTSDASDLRHRASQ